MSSESFLWKMGSQMKNGTQSNKLVMVDSSGQEIGGPDSIDDAAVDYVYRFDAEASVLDPGQSIRTTLFVFIAVSIACTTAAIAAGSYAIWLSKRQAAHKTLTDVNDILKTCQARMRQLETDVQQLPSHVS